MLQVDLKVLEGRQQGKLIPLNVRQFLIGREQDCHLRPNTDLVSRHHCVFTIDDFTVRLRDLGSTNGTYVNGERIQGQVVLKPGDTVVVGKLSFEIVVRQGAPISAGKAGSGSSASVPVAEPVPGPESMETSLNISDTMEFPTFAPPGEDTAILPSFPAPENAPQQATLQPGYNMPGAPYGVPGYAIPQGYGMPPGYPPGYPPPGYPAGYAPGYAIPNYMPMPGYGMPQMMPGYGAPATPAPAQTQVPEMPEVSLPDPETTGAKPAAPPPPPAPPVEGDAAAAPVAKKPSDAAADIIRSHRMRRPT